MGRSNKDVDSSENGGAGTEASAPASGITPRLTRSRITTVNELSIHRRATALTFAVMLMALLSCSASQLRMQLAYPHTHSYTKFVYCLIGTCIAFEILSGFMYIFLSRHDFAEHIVQHVYTALIFCLFVIAITCLFITSLTADDSICKMLKLEKLKLLRRQRRLLAAQGVFPFPNSSSLRTRQTPLFNQSLGLSDLPHGFRFY